MVATQRRRAVIEKVAGGRAQRAPWRLFLPLSAALAVGACGTGVTTTPGPQAPSQPPPHAGSQLVLLVVIDQLSSEAYARLEPVLSPTGALRTLAREGRFYEHAVYPYATTFTAPGHTAIVSGAEPARSGVTSNFWVERGSGRRRSSVDDGVHPVFGKPGSHAGPDALRVETVADVLAERREGQPGGSGHRVVSLSLKDRAAILSAGKRPQLVLWYEPSIKGFTSSSYYMEALPQWLTAYQQVHPVLPAKARWEPADPQALAAQLGADDAPGEGDYKGAGRAFPHIAHDDGDGYRIWRMHPQSSEYLLDLAHEAAVQLQLGRQAEPDLLVVSISGTDYAGHVFGPDSWEYADHLRRADLAIAKLLARLRESTQVSVLITSDHGVAPLPERGNTATPTGAPLPEPQRGAQRINPQQLAASVDAAIDGQLGEGDWVGGFAAPYLFLSSQALRHPEASRIVELAVSHLRTLPGIGAAYDATQPDLLPTDDPVAASVRLSIHPETSGQVFVVTAPYWIPDVGITPGQGTTHGSPYPYDSHVPVWIGGAAVTPGRQSEQVSLLQVAPTLAALLGVRPPAAASLEPLPGLAR